MAKSIATHSVWRHLALFYTYLGLTPSAIRSMPFQSIRRELKIDKHWVVLVSVSALPSDATLIDTFYEIVDRSDECSIIDLLP
jgi:hypothetical protein